MSDQTRYATREVAANVAVDTQGPDVRMIYTDADLDGLTLLLTPASAMKLGQMLIDVATKLESPT